MKIRKILVLTGVILLSTAPSLLAGGRGGHGGGGHRGQSSPQSMGHHGQETGIQDRRRPRIYVNNQQRDQYRICTQFANRVRSQAHNMVRFANSSGFNADRARQQRDQLRNEFRAMQREHNRFIHSLSEEQLGAMEDHIRKMNQARDRVNAGRQVMDEGFKQANLDRKHIAKQAREIERGMKEWQKQYHKMDLDMEIER